MADQHKQQKGPPRSESVSSRGKKRASSSSQPAAPPNSQPFLQPTTQLATPLLLAHPPIFQIPPLPGAAGPHAQHARTPNAKIAIPRLRRDSDVTSAVSSKGGDKHRVSHACEPCRHRKTKCSGERPVCKHCEDFKINCVYADGKRDRVRKEFGNMVGKLEEYEKLLRELSLRVDEPDQILISKLMEKDMTPDEDDLRSTGASTASAFGRADEADADGDEADGEAGVSAEVGSTGSLDRVKEDLNRSATSRATGFMGKNSEVSWVRSLKRQTEEGSQGGDGGTHSAPNGNGNGFGPSGATSGADWTATWTGAQTRPDPGEGTAVTFSDSTYHCDDINVLMPGQVELYEIPPKQTADALFRCYLETVHPSFPIIGKLTFSSQFRTFFESDKTPGNNWLAILNLIFAIGAKYSHLIHAEWRGDERDHSLYFTRARLLAMNSDTILSHPDLQQVQVAGLMAFYLLAIDQVNRAWILSGIAIRYGITLGLNLRNDNPKMSDTSKEIRYRVWWSLSSTERVLAIMTGRPTSISDTECTVPLPVPMDEEAFPATGKLYGDTTQRIPRQANYKSLSPDISISTPSSTSSGMKSTPASSSPPSRHSSFDVTKAYPPSQAMYFIHYTKLSILTNEVCRYLYSPTTLSESWARIQHIINVLDGKLEKWRASLSGVFDFGKKQRDQQFARHRMCLGFFYYSAKTLISRPALCRVDRRIPKESGKSKDFNRTTATKCVHAAKAMLNMLPDEPNPVGLYKVAPWWCLLHYLMQAATVLMLELAIRADHMPFETDEIVNSAKKAVHWLNKMSEESLAARRAWKICHDMLHRVAAKVGRDVNDMSSSSRGSPDVTGREHAMMPPTYGYPAFPSSNFLEPAPPHVAHHPNHMGYGGEHNDHLAMLPSSIYTAHDELLPYDTTGASMYEPIFNTMFPTATQMDAMIDGAYSNDDMFYGMGQHDRRDHANE